MPPKESEPNVSLKGRKNAYVCPTCGGIIVTIDRDEGVTPFMLKCRATSGCAALAESSFYRLPPGLECLSATYEWYRPSKGEIRAASRAMREHYKAGGLALRKIQSDPI